MTIDLDDLLAKAKAGTQGEWTTEHRAQTDLDGQKYMTDGPALVMAIDYCEFHPIADCSANYSCGLPAEDNAAFIAAAQPKNVIALIERLKRVEEALKYIAEEDVASEWTATEFKMIAREALKEEGQP